MQTFSPSVLTDAHERAQRLRRLLDEEFDALRAQDLDRFDTLQQPKIELLQHLSGVVEARRARLEEPADLHETSLWDGLLHTLDECRSLHRRNEILIDRKRDAIQGALQALTGGAYSSVTETYDRLGRVVRKPRGRGYEFA